LGRHDEAKKAFKKYEKIRDSKYKKKAWLITWEWRGLDYAAVADKVVCILNPRWSEERVSKILEFLFAILKYSVHGFYKNFNKKGCYRPIIDGKWICIPDNPSLCAHKVWYAI
jgi:hypothetical protein